MMCGRPGVLLCAAGIVFVSLDPASAQPVIPTHPATAPAIATGQSDSIGIGGQVPTVAPRAQTPAKPPRPRRPDGPPAEGQQPVRVDDTRTMAQGFSVVLVLADLTASSAQDDVPPAARRALADLKDFLPYKSYKLLDAAWLLGQGQQTIRLRGPEEQQYELRLTTPGHTTSAGRLSVQFMLREAQLDPEAEAALAHLAETSTVERSAELERLERDIRAAREKGDQAKARQLERQAAAALARDRRLQSERKLRVAKSSTNRPMIDTSFTMEVGETVVVGTSRLKGNNQALIALLTAVPPRSAGSPGERR